MFTHLFLAGATLPLRITLVSDEPLDQRRLSELLAGSSDLLVSFQTRSQCLEARPDETASPDLVLLGLSQQDHSALQTVLALRQRHPQTAILGFHSRGEIIHREILQATRAMGGLDRLDSAQQLSSALRSVLSGHILLSDQTFHQLVDHSSRDADHRLRVHLGQLTEREWQVFQRIGEGYTTAEISAQLALSAKTVETHRLKIKMRLNLRNSHELTCAAVRWVLGRFPSHGHPGNAEFPVGECAYRHSA